MGLVVIAKVYGVSVERKVQVLVVHAFLMASIHRLLVFLKSNLVIDAGEISNRG